MFIIFVLAGISLVSFDKFGREIELENAAYDVALTIRTAQFFGINRKDEFGSGFEDPKPYGIYFNISFVTPVDGVGQENFMLFVDQDGGSEDTDKLFNNNYSATSNCVANSSTECVDIFTMHRGNYISNLCAGDGPSDCDTEVDRTANAVEELHITFKRPNPDATIKSSSVATHAYALITLSSPITGIPAKRISVGTAGQISIE